MEAFERCSHFLICTKYIDLQKRRPIFPQLRGPASPSINKYLFPGSYCVGPGMKERSSPLWNVASKCCQTLVDSRELQLFRSFEIIFWSLPMPRKFSCCRDNTSREDCSWKAESEGEEGVCAQGLGDLKLWLPDTWENLDSLTVWVTHTPVPHQRSYHCDLGRQSRHLCTIFKLWSQRGGKRQGG